MPAHDQFESQICENFLKPGHARRSTSISRSSSHPIWQIQTIFITYLPLWSKFLLSRFIRASRWAVIYGYAFGLLIIWPLSQDGLQFRFLCRLLFT